MLLKNTRNGIFLYSQFFLAFLVFGVYKRPAFVHKNEATVGAKAVKLSIISNQKREDISVEFLNIEVSLHWSVMHFLLQFICIFVFTLM